MRQPIIINEAEAVRDEPRQMVIDGRQISCLAVVMASSSKTEDIKAGSLVEFKGRGYVVHQKEIPESLNSPIVYLILLDQSSADAGMEGGKEVRAKNL